MPPPRPRERRGRRRPEISPRGGSRRKSRRGPTQVPLADCPSAFDAAYEQSQAVSKACYASAALRHSEFGFLRRGEIPLRYYTVDWPGAARGPGRRVSRKYACWSPIRTRSTSWAASSSPRSAPTAAPEQKTRRTDRLQLLWMENQLRTAPEGAWTFTLMHHPPYSPRGCVFKFLGTCIGGHEDEHALKPQLRSAWGAGDDERSNGAHHPDFVFTAHNHFYARTRSLDGMGYPAAAAGSGSPLLPHRRRRRSPVPAGTPARPLRRGRVVPSFRLHARAAGRGLLLGDRRPRAGAGLRLRPPGRDRRPLHREGHVQERYRRLRRAAVGGGRLRAARALTTW